MDKFAWVFPYAITRYVDEPYNFVHWQGDKVDFFFTLIMN